MEPTIYVVYSYDGGEVVDALTELVDTDRLVNKYFTDLATAEACRDYYNAKRDEIWDVPYHIATLQNGNFIDYNSLKEKVLLERQQQEAQKAEAKKQQELRQLAELKAKYES